MKVQGNMMCNLRIVIVLVVLSAYSLPKTSARSPGITSEEQTRILQGIEAGKALAKALDELDFRNSLQKLGTNLASFLGVLAPFASIALSSIPTGDSAEFSFMKKKFKDVNSKLDDIRTEFKKIKNSIDWSAVSVSYGTYEKKIRAAEDNLNSVYKNERAAREAEKQNFITQYNSNFDDSLQKLYDATVNDDHVFSTNVLEGVVTQTQNSKRKFEIFALGLIQLLVQGIKVKVSYYAMKNWSGQHVVDEWDIKMTTLKSKLQEVSSKLKDRWLTQLRTDATDIILRSTKLSNKHLMAELYRFMTKKYDWRYFFVAVYDKLKGLREDIHSVVVCGGYTFCDVLGRNIIIASQDKEFESKNYENEERSNLVQSVVSDYDSCRVGLREHRLRRSQALVHNILGKVEDRCSPYKLILAVTIHNGFHSITKNGHTSVRRFITPYSKLCCWWINGGYRKSCSKNWWHHDLIIFS